MKCLEPNFMRPTKNATVRMSFLVVMSKLDGGSKKCQSGPSWFYDMDGHFSWLGHGFRSWSWSWSWMSCHGHGHGHGCHDPDGHFLMVMVLVMVMVMVMVMDVMVRMVIF